MAHAKQVAFTKAYQTCYDRFVRYCYALTLGQMDPEDLIQEVLEGAYKNFDNIARKDQLLHYLIRAARNRFINECKRISRQRTLAQMPPNPTENQSTSPEVMLDLQYMFQQLDQLPERQKNALILFEVNGFSMREIAEQQQSTEGAIKTLISRGRKRLKVLMTEAV